MKRLLAVLCLVQAAAARAEWPSDAGVDVPVADVDSSETPAVIADQQGGVFVVFSHQDKTPSSTVRGEHFNATGDRLWGVADSDGGFIGKDLLGLSIGAITGGQTQAFTDGRGGFIVLYAPGGPSGPFTGDAQRFDDTGAAQWAPTGTFGGVEMPTNPSYYNVMRGVSDQTGGALLAYDTGAGTIGQRVDSTGAIDYGTGYLFSGAQPVGIVYTPMYVNGDGQGGMYFIWPNGGSEDISPTLDHLDPAGTRTFDVTSVAPQYAIADNWTLSGLPDGGGSWTAWQQSGWDAGLYLQLFASDGGAILTDVSSANGLFVAAPATIPSTPTLVSDGTGGVVLAWFDVINSTQNVIYAQRFGPDGAPLWGAHPILVTSSETTPIAPNGSEPVFRLVPTTDDNVAFFWTKSPSGIYAEKIAIDGGSKLWGPLSGGVAVSTVATVSRGPQWAMDVAFAPDDSAYVTYQNQSGGIYIKHVLADGTLGSTPAADAGSTEDAGADAGPEDAGVDAGPVDAGVDAGPTDAGTDAGPADAGSTQDAGPDAGGQKPDAGGTTPDAGGTSDAGFTTSSGGCGCGSTGAGRPWEVTLLALSLLVARRRFKRQA